jgi:hypothetical protein
MATKKKTRKKPRGKRRLVGSDPPIMVGGGGSSFIWIAKDLDPQFFQPSEVPGGAPKPLSPDDYYCFRIQANIGKIVIDEGSGAGPGKPVNEKKYSVKFQS